MGMLPGMQEARQQLDQIDDKDLTRIEAIIRSMTPAEREDPKILDGSRRARIARGAGVHTAEVNQLVTRFLDAQKMMRKMRSGGGMPGMPGFGGGRKGQAKKVGKGAKKSGNPAKRAQDEALAAQRALEVAENGGPPIPKTQEEMQAAMDGLKLPPGLGGLLGK
jgi:signal recognition particle subunit SRP54